MKKRARSAKIQKLLVGHNIYNNYEGAIQFVFVRYGEIKNEY